MGRLAFYAVEVQTPSGGVFSHTFRTLAAARRCAKRWAPARIIRQLGAERREVV